MNNVVGKYNYNMNNIVDTSNANNTVVYIHNIDRIYA